MAMKKNSNSQKNIYQVFDPATYTSTGISRNEVLEIKDAFDLLDPASSGTVDPKELRSLFKAYGVELKNQSLEILVEEATANNKPVDFAAFLQMFTAFFYGGKSRTTYKKVFRVFDDENMGCISAKNLRRVVKELGLQLEEAEIQLMIDRADSDNDGVISEEEFYLIMTRLSSKA